MNPLGNRCYAMHAIENQRIIENIQNEAKEKGEHRKFFYLLVVVL